jgi:hypothetical protein
MTTFSKLESGDTKVIAQPYFFANDIMHENIFILLE